MRVAINPKKLRKNKFLIELSSRNMNLMISALLAIKWALGLPLVISSVPANTVLSSAVCAMMKWLGNVQIRVLEE